MGQMRAQASSALRETNRIRTFLDGRRRLLPLVVLATVCAIAIRVQGGATGEDLNGALGAVLARSGLDLDPEHVLWIDPPGRVFRGSRVVFLAQKAGELPDLYRADVRGNGTDTVVDVAWLSNLTRTQGATEASPRRIDHHVFYESHVDGALDAVAVLDLNGEDRSVTEGWPLRTRLQNAITNLQETGSVRGVGRRRYKILDGTGPYRAEVTSERFSIDGP
ncbi:MAG: hypothetical protein KC416_14825, partial [Myxococcales bacterium]|nr:hypothetical protein [Myxococcales bacterium]